MEEEVTIPELIDKVKNFIKFCWTKKYWILLFALLGAIIGGGIAYTSRPTYTATITFMVKEDESNSALGGVASILGSLGFGGSKTKFNLDKVVALASSENIVRKALLDTIEIDGKPVLMGNKIIQSYNLLDIWKKQSGPISKFTNISHSKNFSIEEQSALKALYDMVVGSGKNGMVQSSFNENNTIISIEATTISDSISYFLVKNIFQNLQNFYIFQGIQKAQITVENLERKVSRVEAKLHGEDYSLASEGDKTLGVWKNVYKVPQTKLMRNVQINSVMYGELIKNLETARFALENATPVFQKIDEPFFPIKINIKPLIKFVLYGSILGLMLSFLFFYFWHIYNDKI